MKSQIIYLKETMKEQWILFRNMILYIFLLHHVVIEARVYCQDSNASPWMPLGFSCPVVCASVLNAIDRLIMMDYKKSVKHQLGVHPKINNNMLNYPKDSDDIILPNYNLKLSRKALNSMHSKGKTKFNENQNKNIVQENDGNIKMSTTHKNIYNKNYSPAVITDDILENVKYVRGVLRRSNGFGLNKTNDNNQKMSDGKCWFLEKFKPKLLLGKVVRRKCTRRGNFDGKFVSIMTNVLNKYVDRVDTVLKFTDEMTEILLENIFGKNADLRNNILDVNKLLNYLRKSVDRHKIHSHDHVITLQSRRCLTVSIPGCFCKAGYVESSGQCVRPEDCVADENYIQYVTRIIVL